MGRVGVLALQGDFAAHGRMLDRLGVAWQEVRTPRQLAQVEGLIMPGGESTTLLKLLMTSGLWEALGVFHAEQHPLMGTCAGLIVLARETRQPAQTSLGYIDLVAIRNAYGRQVDSFITVGETVAGAGLGDAALEMVFIRAPKMLDLGPEVVPLAKCRDDVVLARQGTVLAATFHPELTSDCRVHQYFLDMIAATV
jgi:5'-phosphate synthase pdxT subunit